MIKRPVSPTKNRIFFLGILVIFVSVLFGNLFHMQIVKGNEYLFSSKNAYANFRVDRAQRGLIYDRNGIQLVENVPRFKVFIQKISNQESPELKTVIENLSRVFDKNVQEIYEKEYARVKNFKNINEVRIFTNIEYNPYIFQIEANPERFPLVEVEKYMMRRYLYPELVSHIVGYTGEITAEDYETGKFQYGDEIGKYGVEKGFDEILRGQNGLIRTDFYGTNNQGVISPAREKINGSDIFLTIDLKYQRKLYELIEKTKSNRQFNETLSFGVVAQDVNNGEILAMASYPTFDSNAFVAGISDNQFKEYLDNPGKPLSNKATQYSQSPGSTFKVLTDLVALNEGAISPNTIYEANGTWEFGGVTFPDAGRQRHGNIDMARALCVSSNIYHMKASLALEEKTGGKAAEKMQEYFEKIGLNRVSGINIGTESIGYYPIPADKRARGLPWFTGYLLNSSIGQGEVRMSPIAQAQMTSVIANRGKVIPQTIVKGENQNRETKTLDIKPSIYKDIEKGLKCATELNNTYLGIKNEDYPVIGIKTGSAETGQIIKGKEIIHGWEISYGPLQKPQIAMSIFMEGAAGGWKGGYISREFYKYYTEQNP